MKAKDHLNDFKTPIPDVDFAPAQRSPDESESAWEGFEDEDFSQPTSNDQSASDLNILNVPPKKENDKNAKAEGKASKKSVKPRAKDSAQGNPFDALGGTAETDELDGELV